MKKVLLFFGFIIFVLCLTGCGEKEGINRKKDFSTKIEVQSDTPDFTKAVTCYDPDDGYIDIKGSHIVSNNVNLTNLGKYQVKYSVRASNGTVYVYTLDVEVVDTTRPVLSNLRNRVFKTGSAKPQWDEGVTAYDNYDGYVTDKIYVNSTKVNMNQVGIYEVTYSVADSSGNKAIEKIKVFVDDFALEVSDQEQNENTFNELTAALATYQVKLTEPVHCLVKTDINTYAYVQGNQGASITMDMVIDNDDFYIENKTYLNKQLQQHSILIEDEGYLYQYLEDIQDYYFFDYQRFNLGTYEELIGDLIDQYSPSMPIENIYQNETLYQKLGENHFLLQTYFKNMTDLGQLEALFEEMGLDISHDFDDKLIIIDFIIGENQLEIHQVFEPLRMSIDGDSFIFEFSFEFVFDQFNNITKIDFENSNYVIFE